MTTIKIVIFNTIDNINCIFITQDGEKNRTKIRQGYPRMVGKIFFYFFSIIDIELKMNLKKNFLGASHGGGHIFLYRSKGLKHNIFSKYLNRDLQHLKLDLF